MSSQIRSNFGDILTRIKAQIVAELDYPDNRVIISIRREVPHFNADSDIIIRPLGFRAISQITDQTGRFATAVTRRLEVRARTRLALDEASRDEIWLTDESRGHLQLEDQIVDALQSFIPVTSTLAPDAMTLEPLFLIDGSDPDQQSDRGRGQPANWGESRLTFEVSYIMALTQE